VKEDGEEEQDEENEGECEVEVEESAGKAVLKTILVM
jgi:hypothetical protein